MSTAEVLSESLSRARGNFSVSNYGAIYAGFLEMGIPESDIIPRVNVFTYNAWRAIGRQVRKGEHGVKVITWIPTKRKAKDGTEKETGGKICRTTTVFHFSQTDAIPE